MEITLDTIHSLLLKIDERMDTAETNISFLMNAKASETKLVPEIEQPVIVPPKNGVKVTHKGINYEFKVAKFRLLGDVNIYISEEAADVPELIERILAIKGQNVLKEIF